MKLDIMSSDNAKASKKLDVSDKAFGQPFNEALVHQVVTAYLAGGRAGTKAQKSRSEVQGGGAKPWRQKGTGRARAGTSNSPIWRGGGATFAAKPRDFSQKINKKVYKAAMRSMLSESVKQERLMIVDTFSLETPKTRALAEKLKALSLSNVLLVLDTVDKNIELAARNLPHVHVCSMHQADPVSLMRFDKVVMTVPVVQQFEAWLS